MLHNITNKQSVGPRNSAFSRLGRAAIWRYVVAYDRVTKLQYSLGGTFAGAPMIAAQLL